MKNVVTRGLPLLALLLLIGGCSSSTCNPCNQPNPCTKPCPSPCDPCAPAPCPPPCEPVLRPCPVPYAPPTTPGEWPDACHDPLTAAGMLNQILFLAQNAGEGIEAADLAHIERRVPECLEPGLTGGDPPVPVMQMTDPEPCTRLREIYDAATEAATLPKGDARGRWHTIAQELESFPNLP